MRSTLDPPNERASIDVATSSANAWMALRILGFLLVKSWSHLAIIWEVYWSFVRQGYWYMIPLLVAMLTIGNLLIVASSSPFIAPFIYTLF